MQSHSTLNASINSKQTLKQLQQALSQKTISALELAQDYLNKIKSSTANSFIDVNVESTLTQAKLADAMLANGNATLLTGIPVAHKDVFVTTDFKSSAGSRMLADYVSLFNATVVQTLANQGMVCLGKTNMDEFAMGSSNEHSYFGAVDHPLNKNYIPGGSSGGSAAAVALNLAPVATGSDTGGSIRQPASFCGITGIKPTYGSVSRYGMIAYASSLDQAGVMAHNAYDCAMVLKTLMFKDVNDETNIAHPTGIDLTNFDALNASNISNLFSGLTIGVPKEFFSEHVDNEVASQTMQAIHAMQAMGATIKDIELPHTALSIPTYYIIAPAEASSNLARFDGVRYGHKSKNAHNLQSMYEKTRSEGFGLEVQKRLMIGAYVLSQGFYDAYYLQALKVRRLIAQDFSQAFKDVDIIMGPVAPSCAWKKQQTQDSTHMYLADIFTLGASLAGLPAMSMPCGQNKQGMPIGVQMIGNYFTEELLLKVAHAYQLKTVN